MLLRHLQYHYRHTSDRQLQHLEPCMQAQTLGCSYKKGALLYYNFNLRLLQCNIMQLLATGNCRLFFWPRTAGLSPSEVGPPHTCTSGVLHPRENAATPSHTQLNLFAGHAASSERTLTQKVGLVEQAGLRSALMHQIPLGFKSLLVGFKLLSYFQHSRDALLLLRCGGLSEQVPKSAVKSIRWLYRLQQPDSRTAVIHYVAPKAISALLEL